MKGWTVIFVAAVLGFATKDSKPMYVWLAAIPTLSFWMLDGFYLNQEWLFRRLYDTVRETDEDEIDFSMDTIPFKKGGDWFKAVFFKDPFIFLCYNPNCYRNSPALAANWAG